MPTGKVWTVINFSLILFAMLLVLNLTGVNLPTLGKAQYWLNPEEPLCVVNWKDDFTAWNNLDRCCLEKSKQLTCEKAELTVEEGRLDWVCYTDGTVKYWLNDKANYYCEYELF